MTRCSPKRAITAFVGDDAGSSAVEFALVVPLVAALLFVSISVGGMAFSAAALHFATQDAARCGAVKTNICTDDTATQTYALLRYKGPTAAPTFTAATTATCKSVTATATYDMFMGLNAFPVSLSAQACYPLQPT